LFQFAVPALEDDKICESALRVLTARLEIHGSIPRIDGILHDGNDFVESAAGAKTALAAAAAVDAESVETGSETDKEKSSLGELHFGSFASLE
jgi:hypothetical protein